jgi:phage shock protein PspC (stress-responsive transcriptional regulator)
VNPRRLYRSRDRQLAGVAGGMAEYLDIDPTVVRILWIVVGIASGGLVLLAYLILALVIPQAPYATAPGAPAGWAAAGAPAGWAAAPGASTGWTTPPAAPAWDPAPAVIPAAAPAASPRAKGQGIGAAAIFGIVLVVIGGIALADAVLPGWASGAILGPAVILALGAALLASSIRRTSDDAPTAAAPTPSAEPAPQSDLVATAQAWDATDTQAVDPSDFGSTTVAAVEPTEGEGALQA